MRVASYVLSSHWDREWHEPVEVFRRRLVQLLDDVLDAIAASRLSCPFTCDGQSVVLEDYLEVRGERAAELRAALASGMIIAGPWYVPPDELLVSGESLIRNLQIGRRVVRELGGKPSDAGFLGDLFGHNSQMPQIFNGFGIRGGFLWRGLNLLDQRHVLWRGADGTTLPCYRFGTNGYWGFAVHVAGFTSSDPEKKLTQGITERLRNYLADEAECTQIDSVLLFDGADHQQYNPRIQKKVSDLFGDDIEAAGHTWRLRPTTLDAYQGQMLAEAKRITHEVSGELLEPARYDLDRDQQWLIAGTLSSRIPIKQANAAGQAWLCHAAEPWSAVIGRATGEPDPPGMLDRAWRLLLKNHAHDSICGCSIDTVHDDVTTRLRRSQQVARTLAGDAWRKIARRADLPTHAIHRRLLLVNPTPRPRAAVTEVTVHIPAAWPTACRFNFAPEPVAHFDLLDEEGQAVAFQRLEQTLDLVNVERLFGRSPSRYRAHRMRLAVAADLPAMGYRTLRVVPLDPTEPMRGRPRQRGMMLDDHSMANEHVEVRFEANGTFTLIDFSTGERYARQLTFEDAGDVGDGWNFEAPANNTVHSSAVGQADVSLVHDGPLQTTFRIRVNLGIPEKFDRAAQSRSSTTSQMVVDSYVTLLRGDPAVHVRTDIDHQHEDHRLRVLFPTDIEADRYWADTPFDVVERKVGLPHDAEAYREDPVETRPQQSWTATHAGRRGLAVVAAGLPESAVLDRRGRPIALTLLRATRRTVFTNGEPGGQLRQKLSFRYSLRPLAGAPDRASLCELGQRLNLETSDTIEASPIEVEIDTHAKRLPPRGSILKLQGPGVLTSFRECEGSIEARLFNPETHEISTKLEFAPSLGGWSPPACATPVDFESNPIGPTQAIDHGTLKLTLQPKQIVTLRLDHS